MFKRTSSLGTVLFKGQRALVIEGIAKIPDPFTRDQVGEAIDKVAYEKTFKKRKQVVTIPESVQYHLRELTNLGQLAEVASPIPVVRRGRGLDLGIGGRMGSENQGVHRAEAYSACIIEMALKHSGYGRWDAPYWFIGPEPGQHGGNNIEERRADFSFRLRREEVAQGSPAPSNPSDVETINQAVTGVPHREETRHRLLAEKPMLPRRAQSRSRKRG